MHKIMWSVPNIFNSKHTFKSSMNVCIFSSRNFGIYNKIQTTHTLILLLSTKHLRINEIWFEGYINMWFKFNTTNHIHSTNVQFR